MQKIAIGLSALLLIATPSKPGAAQDVSTAGAAQRQAECAEYFGCLDYGSLTEAKARRCRGHPQFVEARTEARSAGGLETVTPSSRVERDEMPAATQSTWRENPSLMDSSWRQWPSLTDF